MELNPYLVASSYWSDPRGRGVGGGGGAKLSHISDGEAHIIKLLE